MIKVTYDKSVDAVYITLDADLDSKYGWSKKVITVDPAEVGGMINLDFTGDNKLGGIEIIDASYKLPKSILDEAEIIG